MNEIDLKKYLKLATTTGLSMVNSFNDTTTSYYDNTYNAELEYKKTFYSEMLELMNVDKQEKVSMMRMISSADEETIIIFKQLFKNYFNKYLEDTYEQS